MFFDDPDAREAARGGLDDVGLHIAYKAANNKETCI